MTTNKPIYTPEEAGSGQWGICAKCGLGPTAEGHDGCLGTLPDPVMNACCGHGNDRQAYVQFWGGDDVRGADAIALQAKMKNETYKNWQLFDDMPSGWTIDKTCGSPLTGYVFITNGRSVLRGGKRALLRVRGPQQQKLTD